VGAVLMLGVTTWRVWSAEADTREANKHLQEALDRVKQEEQESQEALAREAVERARAEANYREARKLLLFLTRLGVEDLAGKPQAEEVRRRLLTELLAYYQE